MERTRRLLLALTLLAFAPAQAQASWWHVPHCDPDSIGSGDTTITDETFGTYTVRKTFEIFSDKNCGNPRPVNGSITYVYTLEVLDPPSSLGITSFLVPTLGENAVVEAGFVWGGPDVEPSATTVEPAQVRWDFTDGPGALLPGQKSAPLYIVSPFTPGTTEVSVAGQFGLDAQGQCVGPSALPDPCPCSAFFWKLRAKGWWWIAHRYFPGQEFHDIVDRAVELSGGYFADAWQLKWAVKRWGWLSIEKRAERQLAALLLNLAAGELFPANTKCRLFQGTEIDLDGDDIGDTTVAAALADIIMDIESGDPYLQAHAFHFALDINLGRNVVGAVRFH